MTLQAAEKTPPRQWTLHHGVAGPGAGLVIAMLLLLRSSLSGATILTLAGLGCLIYGGIGLYLLIDKNLTSLRRVSIIAVIFYFLLGLLLVLQALGVGALATTLQIINFVIILGGIALTLWAFILKNDAAR